MKDTCILVNIVLQKIISSIYHFGVCKKNSRSVVHHISFLKKKLNYSNMDRAGPHSPLLFVLGII